MEIAALGRGSMMEENVCDILGQSWSVAEYEYFQSPQSVTALELASPHSFVLKPKMVHLFNQVVAVLSAYSVWTHILYFVDP